MRIERQLVIVPPVVIELDADEAALMKFGLRAITSYAPELSKVVDPVRVADLFDRIKERLAKLGY